MSAKSKNSVFIVGGSPAYKTMFEREGWQVVRNICNADVIQFTGGWDVNPKMYGEDRHPKTIFYPARDDKERIIFNMARHLRIPMTGICRGGQFLNVMCGGRLYQDVNNHRNEKGGVMIHPATDAKSGEVFSVTSTHHQMMIPKAGSAEIVLTAATCTLVERMVNPMKKTYHIPKTPDIEALFYPAESCFCFQPHPEFGGQRHLARRYFDYLERYLGVGMFIIKKDA